MSLPNYIGKQHADQIIGGDYPEVTLAGRQVSDGFGCDGRFYFQQDLAHRQLKLFGVGCRLHLTPDLNQQIIVKICPQAT
ncbi:hypothetical protein D3C84_1023880 [compost metagenome]